MLWALILSIPKTPAGFLRGPKAPEDLRVLKKAVVEVREARLHTRPSGKMPSFYPQAPGDGWILPTNVAYTGYDEWTPTIVRDNYGVFWASVNRYAYSNDYGWWWVVDIYYSSDNGNSWNYYTSVVAWGSSAGYDLGDPVLGYDPATQSLVLTFDGLYWYYDGSSWVALDYDVGVCRWTITGAGSLNSFSGKWLSTSSDNDMVPALAVERGHSNNYAFVSFERDDGTVRVWRLSPVSLSGSQVWSYYGSGGYAGQVWSSASDRVIQVTFKEGSGWDACYTAVYAYSLDRGSTWHIVKRSFSYPVYQSTSAAAFGSNYAVWTIQVNVNSSDGNVYMLWSTDNGQTWAAEYWLEHSVISLDSRMPMLCAERSEVNSATSEFFYFGAYREVVSGSGKGNYWFLMAPVSNADDSADWKTPPNVDQFVIPSSLLDQYNIQEANWAQLHLVAFPFNGGYAPGVIWAHAYSSDDHDIHFSRPIVPLYQDVKLGNSKSNLKLLTTVSRGELRFQLPSGAEGLSLKVYRPDGTIAWEGPLRERVNLETLPAGAYVWSAGKAKGRFVLVR